MSLSTPSVVVRCSSGFQITDMVMYGAERLISMHGPRLTYLDLTIPLSEGQTKDTTNGMHSTAFVLIEL